MYCKCLQRPTHVSVSVFAVLHSEVSVDISGHVLLVEHKVVSDNVERQAGAPVGRWVIRCGSGTSSSPSCGLTAPLLLLGFFFLLLCHHIDKAIALLNKRLNSN